jgi:hypothetical protein
MLTHMLLSGVVLENLVIFWSRAKVVVSVHEENMVMDLHFTTFNATALAQEASNGCIVGERLVWGICIVGVLWWQPFLERLATYADMANSMRS